MLSSAASALSLAGALSLGGCERHDDDTRARATIELHPCNGDGDLRCAVLTVEQNREAPDGQQLELHILVAPAHSRTPAADPVFLLAGGPGQGAASIGPHILPKLDALRRERDLVFVDIRGTGESTPLACEIEDLDDLGTLLGATVELERIPECLAAYDPGIDLQQFTTTAIVDDLDEVRAALGYARANLYGISYGTLVAQVWMQRHPEHVRSAVLDAVVPPDVNVSLEAPANNERALKRVLADCREHPRCAAAYPGLERKLAVVLDELDHNRVLEELDHPRTGARTRVDVTRQGFASLLAISLYSASSSSLLPLAIEQAHAGDYGPATAMLLRGGMVSKTISMGLYLSVACAEQISTIDDAARTQAVAGLEVFDDRGLVQLQEICARWPHAAFAPSMAEPLHSEIPTLLLSGAYDPITPPSFGERVAAGLGNARHLVIEHGYHGVWMLGCTAKLSAEFYANPDPAQLDASCLDALLPTPMFLSANGPTSPPLATEHEQEQQ